LISTRSALRRPVAKRVASYVASAPPSNRATKIAASSTVTSPVAPAPPAPSAEAARPLDSTGSGRSLTNVSVIALTPLIRWPVTYWVRSMMCAPMSPRAPDPALSFCSRQTSGNCGSVIQSCR
jgi:hypothetical protein